MTRRLLQWTLEQPTIPLSGILYEQGQSQQDRDLQCGATVKGTSGLVTHWLTNLQASRNQSAQQVSQNPFCIYIMVEQNSASPALSHWVVERLDGRRPVSCSINRAYSPAALPIEPSLSRELYCIWYMLGGPSPDPPITR